MMTATMRCLFTTHPLIAHPDSAAADIAVAVAVSPMADGRWRLDWRVAGNDVSYPHRALPERLDGLWQTTCFELFAMRCDGSYAEWNFSPSGAWAAYAFSVYRKPVSPPPAVEPPVIAWDARAGRWSVAVDTRPLLGSEPLRIGLCAVIERTNGEKAYFALAHPQGRPDFHAGDCFAIDHSPPTVP